MPRKITGNANRVAVFQSSSSSSTSPTIPLDVAYSAQFDAELNRRNRIYWVMSACYQSMLYTTRRSALLQRICDLITKIGGFLSVQISSVDEGKGGSLSFYPEARADGEGLELFHQLLELTSAKVHPHLIKRAVRSVKPAIIRKVFKFSDEQDDETTPLMGSLDPRDLPLPGVAMEGLPVSAIALPLLNQNGRVSGVLSILAGNAEAFNEDEVELLKKLARDLGHKLESLETEEEKNQPAFMSWLAHERAFDLPTIGITDSAVRSKVLNAFDLLMLSYPELSYVYDSIIEGWSHTLDLRDNGDMGHSQRVAERTIQLAREFGMGEEEMLHIRRGALLHDIGKVGIPDRILNKPGALNEKEWSVMRMHPEYAFKLLSPIDFLQKALDIPYCHHERWDGSGYPRGLQGEAIPLAVRIFSIVDVWDALLSNRPYRSGWSEEQALSYIESQDGKYFDPRVVQAFLRYLGK